MTLQTRVEAQQVNNLSQSRARSFIAAPRAHAMNQATMAHARFQPVCYASARLCTQQQQCAVAAVRSSHHGSRLELLRVHPAHDPPAATAAAQAAPSGCRCGGSDWRIHSDSISSSIAGRPATSARHSPTTRCRRRWLRPATRMVSKLHSGPYLYHDLTFPMAVC